MYFLNNFLSYDLDCALIVIFQFFFLIESLNIPRNSSFSNLDNYLVLENSI